MNNITLTTGDLEAILRENNIPALEWGQWSALVFQHQRPSSELIHKLHHVGNYKQALHMILVALSRAVTHKFPPQPSRRRASYAHNTIVTTKQPRS